MSYLSKLISDNTVGMVQAFIDGRCEVKLNAWDIREALEVYLACLLEEVKTEYGLHEIDKRMAQDGGPYIGGAMSSRAQDIAAKAYDIGLQVGATLARADVLGEKHGEFCHMTREQWLAERRAMAIKEACK